MLTRDFALNASPGLYEAIIKYQKIISLRTRHYYLGNLSIEWHSVGGWGWWLKIAEKNMLRVSTLLVIFLTVYLSDSKASKQGGALSHSLTLSLSSLEDEAGWRAGALLDRWAGECGDGGQVCPRRPGLARHWLLWLRGTEQCWLLCTLERLDTKTPCFRRFH